MTRDPRPPREADIMDRMMRAELGRRMGPGSPDCPDAETISAYYEHRLPAFEETQWDSHVAGCQRCQTVLAALVRAEPLTDEHSDRRLARRWTWLVPVAAASTAFALWISHRPSEQTMPASRKVEEVASRTDAPRPAPQATTPSNIGNEQPAAPSQTGALRQKPTPPARPASPAPVTTAPLDSKIAAKPPSAMPSPPLSASKDEAAADVDRLEEDKRDQAMVAESAAGGRARQSAAKTAPAPADMQNLQETMRAASARKELPRPQGVVAPVLVAVPAPGSTVRWRLEASGTISRSTDGGATWTRQSVPTAGALVAGSAPSSSVCWAVGRDGIILRTLDGVHWQKIDPPTMADFATIKANDGLSATVTTTDGRTYRTTDGGLTWRTS